MSVSIPIITKDGKVDGSVDLEGLDFNETLVHQALLHEQAGRRLGCASTKTRDMVRGGGRKPWKQKGTGRARAGSIRSPLWVGGGVVFGPHPRSYANKMPKQMRHAAVASALFSSLEKVKLVADYNFISEGKTSEMAAFLKVNNIADVNVLMLVDVNASAIAFNAARNIKNIQLLPPANLTVDALLRADVIVLTTSDFENLKSSLYQQAS
jgi:large subunit ribosomal protein L4